MLKTIEEPKGNVCFILATTEIHKVPDTIISRCQVFNYRKVSNWAMIAHLENICKSEGLQYVQSALEIITNLSEGCVRDAVKYVDQVSILWDLNEENVSRFLWVAWEALLKEVLTDIKSNDRGAVFSKLDEIANQGIDLSQFAKQMLGYIDQHLLEDTDFYLVCSEIFWNVISTLKWYPYPLIAYKIAINNYFMGNEGESAFVKNWEKKELKIEKAIEKNVASAGNLTTSISENGANENVGGWGSINEESRVEGVAAIGQEKDENGDGDKIEAVGSGEGNWVEGKESIENQGWDFSSLWARVISQMNKPTVQANLKDQAIIEKKEWNVIEITVITAIARMLLENPENKKLLEQLLSKELWENVEMCVSFIKKEEYFSRKMGL